MARLVPHGGRCSDGRSGLAAGWAWRRASERLAGAQRQPHTAQHRTRGIFDPSRGRLRVDGRDRRPAQWLATSAEAARMHREGGVDVEVVDGCGRVILGLYHGRPRAC